jgi:uncharacterized protein
VGFGCGLDVVTGCSYARYVRYEWDEDKRRKNIRKHGIDFVGAERVFDGYTVTVDDDRFAYHEFRFLTLGVLNGRVVVVSHTERGDSVRFISIRGATKNEEERYFTEIRPS